MSLPRKRFKYKNELAKSNPEKQELKIKKTWETLQMVWAKQPFEGPTQISGSAEAAFQKRTMKTGLQIQRVLQVSLLT